MARTHYRSSGDAIHDRIQQRVRARADREASSENCPKCGYYKRGTDGRCADCGAPWPPPSAKESRQ